MMKRPVSVTVMSWVFIAIGAVGFCAHLWPSGGPVGERPAVELSTGQMFNHWLVQAVRLSAVMGGVFMLRGRNWARWLCVAWMGFHVAVSFMHSLQQAAVHLVILGIVLYVLFRPPGSAYFTPRGSPAHNAAG